MSSLQTFHSEDGRLRIELFIEDDGRFTIDAQATKIGTSLKATMSQDMGAVHVGIRGSVRERDSD